MNTKNDTNRILVVDDEAPFREDIAEILQEEGYECSTAESGEEAVELVQDSPPDAVLCDIVMPGMSGIDALRRFQEVCPETGVFMVTAYENLDTAVEAFREGAYDYLTKPVNPDVVIEKIERFLGHRQLANEVHRLRREISRADETRESIELVGESPAMREVFELIDQAGETRSNVLITGESGTGKELTARSVHNVTDREEELPFVPVNCAALTESLLESELFGYTKGAFTGAEENSSGYFETADGGTLFLDEISEMNIDLQAKLLRAIEQKEIQRVGSTETIPVNVRIIASSNRDLKEEVEKGTFREDLYYRLKVLHIPLPPLRKRREDIPLLVDHFIKKYNEQLKRSVLGAENAAMQILMTYDWPGNVRELENTVERWMIVSSDDFLMAEELPRDIRGKTPSKQELSDNLKQAVESYEKQHIRRVLEATEGNRTRAAERLGIDPSTLYRKMNDYGLEG
ncbi:MAG: sigma-54-dependent transcriptional regulator [bacterium]